VFNKSGATARDVALMKFAGKGKLKVKAAGGIRTREDAELMIAAGADRIGASSGVKIIGSN
jgi:deoxyribose-phosphate aldolase